MLLVNELFKCLMQKVKEEALHFLQSATSAFSGFTSFKGKKNKILLTFTVELFGSAAFFFCISVRWFVLTVTAL